MDHYWHSSIHKNSNDDETDMPNRRRRRLRRRPSEVDTASPTTTRPTQTTTIKSTSLTGKRTLSSSWILLMVAVSALLQGGRVHVEAFVVPTTTTTTIKGSTTIKTHGKNQRRHLSASFATSTLTSSSSSNTVSLEWAEFFAPPTPSSLNDDTATTTAATPVLFLHGLLGSKRNFASLGTMLGAQLTTPRRIVGLDLRNHGETGPHMHHVGSMSYPEMAKDVVQWMDTHHIHKCVLVGHSMGGKVAQAISILYPDRVDGLVVLDIAPVQYARDTNPNWKAVEDILRAVARVEGGGDKRTVDKALRPAVPDPALRAFVMTNYDAHCGQWKIPVLTLVRELENIAGFELGDGGDEITMESSHHHSQRRQYDGDVFIIHGGQSKFVRHHHMDAIARYFPNHLLTTIRGAGHWVHAEAPDDTVALLKRFLDR